MLVGTVDVVDELSRVLQSEVVSVVLLVDGCGWRPGSCLEVFDGLIASCDACWWCWLALIAPLLSSLLQGLTFYRVDGGLLVHA